MSFSENYRRWHNSCIETWGKSPSEMFFIALTLFIWTAIPCLIFWVNWKLGPTNEAVISVSPHAKTVEHDKHWYIILRDSRLGTPVHHPDCPCGWGRSADRLLEAHKTFDPSKKD